MYVTRSERKLKTQSFLQTKYLFIFKNTLVGQQT